MLQSDTLHFNHFCLSPSPNNRRSSFLVYYEHPVISFQTEKEIIEWIIIHVVGTENFATHKDFDTARMPALTFVVDENEKLVSNHG